MATVQIDEARLAQIVRLDNGGHTNFEAGVCAMEAAAYIAREPWSDHPECVCPVIGVFMRAWNDGLPDTDRTAILLPLVAKTINTRGSGSLAERRSLMAADWLVRTHTVAWLRLAGLTTQADALASLPEITSMAQVPSILGPIKAVRKDADAAGDAARDAAGDAARDAAGDAAWDAAGDAAGDAARAAAEAAGWDAAGDDAWAAARAAGWDAARDAGWDAARAAAGAAAWDAARDAAGAAAWDAARDAAGAAARAAGWDAARDAGWDAARAAAGAAARDAARAKLEPARKELQTSAVQLMERMCALTDADIAEAA